MTVITINELVCFGAAPGGGNAALVIQGDRRDAAQRQQWASGQNKSACVFVDAPQPQQLPADYVLDFFYPHARSPLCLHATLAAAHVLLSPQRASLPVRTAMRGQPLQLERQDDGVFIRLAPQAPPAVALPDGLAALLLDAPGLTLASAPAIASVGSPKLLLEVADGATLDALRPDLARIAAWGAGHGVSGCYVYCAQRDGSLRGRNFNHLDPRLEDSATGVAAGALTVHLRRGVSLHQGGNVGRPCLIRTALRGEHILIGGAVEAVGTQRLVSA